MRYKELKFENKVFTEEYQINEILINNKFNWIIDCEIQDVRLEITKDTLIWNAGLFYSGVWKYGVFRNGEWRFGTWENGVWYNGVWKDGLFKSGLIFNGKFYHGQILSGEVRGGQFINCDISPSVTRSDIQSKQNHLF